MSTPTSPKRPPCPTELRAAAAALALALAGCAVISPELKDRTDVLVLDYKARKAKRVAPAPGPVPRPWEEGQYVVLLTTLDGEPSLTRYAVTRTTREGVWLSIEKLSYRTRERSRVLFQRQPTTLTETRTLVRRIVQRANDGVETTFDFEDGKDATLVFMKDSLTRPLEILAVTPGGAAQPATVPAGAFDGCVAATATVSDGGSTLNLEGVAHPAVPVNGLVQLRAKGRSASVELVEYGEDGKGSIL